MRRSTVTASIETRWRYVAALVTCPTISVVYDGMKVWEFLDFFAVAYKIGRTQPNRSLSMCWSLLDLSHKRDDYVNGLSRGMKQRLCWPNSGA